MTDKRPAPPAKVASAEDMAIFIIKNFEAGSQFALSCILAKWRYQIEANTKYRILNDLDNPLFPGMEGP